MEILAAGMSIHALTLGTLEHITFRQIPFLYPVIHAKVGILETLADIIILKKSISV
jgi:hypothetical protein